MGESDAVQRSSGPRTRASLRMDLRRLGLQPGMTVLVHSSLSALGWVVGGPVTVVEALMDVITPDGTLVMPAHSSGLSEPSHWQNPPVPEVWWQTIRDTMPPFDPRLTPTRGMGAIVEAFRGWPGVLRSRHPTASFAAWGRHARLVTNDHGYESMLGEESPLARVYDLHGWVLLLGVGYNRNTSFHLAEYRVPNPPMRDDGAPVIHDGQRVWLRMRDVDVDDDPFADIGLSFELTGQARVNQVGSAEARLFRQRAAVDFARDWLLAHR